MKYNLDYEKALKEFNEFNDDKKKELNELLETNQDKLNELAGKKQEIEELKSKLVETEKNMQNLRGLLYDLEKDEYDEIKKEIEEKEKVYQEELEKLAPVASELKFGISYKLGNFIKKGDVDNSEKLYQEESDRLNEEISKAKSVRDDIYKQRDEAQNELLELTKQLAKGMKLEDSKDIRDKMGDLSQKIYDLNLELEKVESRIALNANFLAELELAHDNYKVIEKNTPEYDEYAKLILISDVLMDAPTKENVVKKNDNEPPKVVKVDVEPAGQAPVPPEPVKVGNDQTDSNDTKPADQKDTKSTATTDNRTIVDDQRDVEFNSLIDEFIDEVKIITSNSMDDRVKEIFADIRAEYEKKYADSNTRDAKMSQELREKFDGYLREITDAVEWASDATTAKANRFFDRWTNQALVRFFGEVSERVDENGETIVEPAKPEPAKPEPAKTEPAKPEPVQQEPVQPGPLKPEPTKLDPSLRSEMILIGISLGNNLEYYEDKDGKVYIYDANNNTLEYSEEKTKAQKEFEDMISREPDVKPVEPESVNSNEESDASEKFEEDLDKLNQILINNYPDKVKQINEILDDIKRVSFYRGFMPDVQKRMADIIKTHIKHNVIKDIDMSIDDISDEIQIAVDNVAGYFNNEKLNEDYKKFPEVEKLNLFLEDLIKKLNVSFKYDWQLQNLIKDAHDIMVNCYYYNCLNDASYIKKFVDQSMYIQDKSIVDEVFEKYYGKIEEKTQTQEEDDLKDSAINPEPVVKPEPQKGSSLTDSDREWLESILSEATGAPVKEKEDNTAQDILEVLNEDVEPAQKLSDYDDDEYINDEPALAPSSEEKDTLTPSQRNNQDFLDALSKLKEFLKEVNVAENEEKIENLDVNIRLAYYDMEFDEKAKTSHQIAKEMRNLYDELGSLYSEVVLTGNEKEDNKKIAYLEVLMLKVLSTFSKKVDLARGKNLDDNTVSHDALDTLGMYWSSIEEPDGGMKVVEKTIKPGELVEMIKENASKLARKKLLEPADYSEKIYHASKDLDDAINWNEKLDPEKFIQAITTLTNVPENKDGKATIDYSDFLTKIGEYSKLSKEEQSGEISDIGLVLLASNIMRALSVDAFEKPEIEKVEKKESTEKLEDENTEPTKSESVVKKEETADPTKESVDEVEPEEKNDDPKRMALISALKQYKQIIFKSINVLNDNKQGRKELEEKLIEIVELYDNGTAITFDNFDKMMEKIKGCSDLNDVKVAQLSIIEKQMKDDIFADQFIGAFGKTQKDDLDEYYDYKDGKVHKFSEVSLKTEKQTDIVANEKNMPDLFLKFVNAQAVEDAIAEVEDFISDKTKTKTYKGPKGLFEVLKTKSQLLKQNAFLYKALRRKRQNGEKGNSILESLEILKNPAERQVTLNEVTKRIRKEIEDLRSGAILPSEDDKLTNLMSRTIYKHRKSLGMDLYENFTLVGELPGAKKYKAKKKLLENARTLILKTMRKSGKDGFYAEFNGKEETVYSPRNGQKLAFSRISGAAQPDEPGLKHVFYKDILDQLDVNINVQGAYISEKEAQKEAEKNDDDAR